MTHLEIIKEAFKKIGLPYAILKSEDSNWTYLIICYENEIESLEKITFQDTRKSFFPKKYWEFDEDGNYASC